MWEELNRVLNIIVQCNLLYFVQVRGGGGAVVRLTAVQ